jgi:hypothetical protein
MSEEEEGEILETKEIDEKPSEQEKKKSIMLELGDIIEIDSPSNAELHQNTFFIIYLDDTKIRIVNVSTFHPIVLKLDSHGKITDESIRQITILSRSEEKGYSRQHMLLPKTWINIHFGGEIPTVITGEITNLEEDMIEITTYPDLQHIYIDFEYKGLPEHLPLDQIEIRNKPAGLEKISSLVNLQDRVEDGEVVEDWHDYEDQEASMEFADTGEMILHLPKNPQATKNIRDELKALYLDASEIKFGEDLDDIYQAVELPEHRKRYGIETQVNDMMDELLSEIPNSKRTKAVLDNIHYLIERFRELREQFSKFDTNGLVYDTKLNGGFHKPLMERISNFDTRLKWIVPVVALRKKIYTDIDPENTRDVLQKNMGADINEQSGLLEDYYKNQMRGEMPIYDMLYDRINDRMTPMETPLYSENYLVPKQRVLENIESVVKNLNDFHSTVFDLTEKREGYTRRRFVIQRYNLGQTHLVPQIGKTGKRVYLPEPLIENDNITLASVLVLPEPVLEFSRSELPNTTILDRSNMSQRFFYLFKLLKKNTEIRENVITKFNKDEDIVFWNKENGKNEISEFLLDENLEKDPQRFRKFLETMVPKTSVIIDIVRKYMQKKLSMKKVVDLMEPYKIYISDINYTQYNQIRFFIKEQIKEFKTTFAKDANDFMRLKTMKYSLSKIENRLERIFFEKKEIADMFLDSYSFLKPEVLEYSESETVAKLLKVDQGTLFYSLLQFMMVSLITPENLLEQMNTKESDDMSNQEKIKAKDCVQRVLTKRYDSLKSLQKDNGTEDIFTDKEFDDSPYELYKKYKDEASKFLPEEFIEYIAENLVQKHDCPISMSTDMAKTIISGKRRVLEGEYAILEIKPQLPPNVDVSKLTLKEKQKLEMEANVRKKIEYYRRIKNQWLHDSTIDEAAFIDTNTLFCNMGKICFRNQKANVCDTIENAEERLKQTERKRLLKEFDGRFIESLETVQETLKRKIEYNMRLIKKSRMLDEINSHRYNRIAFELGKYAKAEDILKSPHLELREKILGQADFVKRQTDIVRFAEMFCRDAMVNELGENQFWLYCIDTNTQLLPTFFRDLAQEFLSNGNYQRKLDEICRKQGVMSDDGDSTVDLHSGYVIRKNDLIQEDGFDDNGMKIITHEVIEKDAGQQLLENVAKMKDRVFESETAEMVYRIYAAMARNIGIPIESIDDVVMRLSMELIEKNIKSEEPYNKMADKMEKDKGKRPPPYKIYKNQTILTIVAAIILVAVQTVVPSFKTRKTFPGCIQSFRGYPMDGGSVEDMSGLNYIACVMKKTSSKIEPWNSIEKLPIEILQERIKKVISDYVIPRTDITEMYSNKREYLLLHQDEEIPKEHALEKWRNFLPPIVPFHILKSLKGLTNEYKTELVTLMREGKAKQREHIAIFKTKVLKYSYGFIESISNIVRSKELILKTSSKIPFLENACCNDKLSKTTLEYFAKEDETITPHMEMVKSWIGVLDNVATISKASMLYHPERTGYVSTPLPSEHFSENVYLAFIHYCNLDREAPIPEEFRGLIAEKPAGYNPKGTLKEKIEFLKENGKRFTLENLTQLMEIVNRKNLFGVYTDQLRGSAVSGLNDFIEYLDSQDSSIIEKPLRSLLIEVIKKYDPKVMLLDDLVNPDPASFQLNKYLSRANEEMLDQIHDFIKMNGKLSKKKTEELQDQLANIHIWSIDQSNSEKMDETNMYTVVKFLQNSVYNISRLYPEIIRNNHTEPIKVHTHWNLAGIHVKDITNTLTKYYEPLQQFKNDRILNNYISETQTKLIDLNAFLNFIPVFTPIHKTIYDKEKNPPEKIKLSWFALFSKRTVYMLMSYIWYSVFYEYMNSTENEDLLEADIMDRKEARRHKIQEDMDQLALGESSSEYNPDSDMADYNDDLLDNEVQIEMGNKKELKERVAEMLLAFLKIELGNKDKLDATYDVLSRKMRRSRQDEKKMITDYFKNMDADERRVEDQKKALKLGRWNVGMQKGLVYYDKDTYVREREEMIARLNGNNQGEEIADDPRAKDVNELDADQEMAADLEAEKEANDIAGLDEEYGNGNYYEEDMDED